MDCLISNSKKVFLKASSRVQTFKDKLPEVPLPPAPVVTRWGTWINAALYYAQYLESFCEVIQNFNEDDAVSIRAVKKCLEDSDIQNDLAYISAHFLSLPNTIMKLESANLSMISSFQLLNHEITRLKSTLFVHARSKRGQDKSQSGLGVWKKQRLGNLTRNFMRFGRRKWYRFENFARSCGIIQVCTFDIS